MLRRTAENCPDPVPDQSQSTAAPGAYQITSPRRSPWESSAMARYEPFTVAGASDMPAGGGGRHAPRPVVRSQRPELRLQVMPDPAWFDRGRSLVPILREPEMSIGYPVSERSQWRSSVAPRSTT